MTSVWKGLQYRTVNGHGEKPYCVKGALRECLHLRYKRERITFSAGGGVSHRTVRPPSIRSHPWHCLDFGISGNALKCLPDNWHVLSVAWEHPCLGATVLTKDFPALLGRVRISFY